MKLTKLQRHTAYIIASEMAKELMDDLIDQKDGICYLFYKMGINDSEVPVNDNEDSVSINSWQRVHLLFPEFRKRKPEVINNDLSWFSHDVEGWNDRISILNECIIETY